MLGELREPAASRAAASLPPKERLPHHPQPGALALRLSVEAALSDETTGVSSAFAKHLPTAQSLLCLQGEVSHCLFKLTTKFCQSHRPAVNNEGSLQPSSLRGNADKQEVQPACQPRPLGLGRAVPGAGREAGGSQRSALPAAAHFRFVPLPYPLHC